MFSMRAN